MDIHGRIKIRKSFVSASRMIREERFIYYYSNSLKPVFRGIIKGHEKVRGKNASTDSFYTSSNFLESIISWRLSCRYNLDEHIIASSSSENLSQNWKKRLAFVKGSTATAANGKRNKNVSDIRIQFAGESCAKHRNYAKGQIRRIQTPLKLLRFDFCQPRNEWKPVDISVSLRDALKHF